MGVSVSATILMPAGYVCISCPHSRDDIIFGKPYTKVAHVYQEVVSSMLRADIWQRVDFWFKVSYG